MTIVAASDQGTVSRPLVVKGTERIESIIVRGEDVRLPAKLYTHAMSRTLRREFNIISIALFFAYKKPEKRDGIEHWLHCMTEEATILENAAWPYDMPRDPALTTCEMRIISDEARQLFDAIHIADRALFKIMRGRLAELPDAEKADPVLLRAAQRRIFEMCDRMSVPFNSAYHRLRLQIAADPSRRPSKRDTIQGVS